MSIVLVGVNHRTAPVAVRETLAMSSERQGSLLAGPRPSYDIDELAILSTCNRTEVYAAGPNLSKEAASRVLIGWLAAVTNVTPETLEFSVYSRSGSEAVRHLARVAAGLDSMVLGEMEILGQVGRAEKLATGHRSLGPELAAAFETAIVTGRRARDETGIGRGAASVSTEAVRVMVDRWGTLEGRAILLIGGGKMGRRTGEAIKRHGNARIFVTGRDLARLEEMRRDLDATAVPWNSLSSAIRMTDAIVCSTSAPHPVVSREIVTEAIGGDPPGRTRMIVDIAVPRDVEPEVGQLRGIDLYDLDALQSRLDANLDDRAREIPAVERIVAEEVARFETRSRQRALRPVLAQLHERGEAIRQRELARWLDRMGSVSPELGVSIETFSRALAAKLLNEVSSQMRWNVDVVGSAITAASSDPEPASELTEDR